MNAARTSSSPPARIACGSLGGIGRILGWIGLYLAVTASISVATYYVLREFAA